MTNLGYILPRAWEIVRRHKQLWALGLLVGLETTCLWSGMLLTRWERLTWALPPEARACAAELLAGRYGAAIRAALALAALTIGIGLTLLGTMARAALADQARAAEDRGAVSLRVGWQAGARRLGHTLLIRLLLALPLSTAIGASSLPAAGFLLIASRTDRPLSGLAAALAAELTLLACFFPALLAAALLSIPLGVMRRLAILACTLEGLPAWPSIHRAWTTAKKQPGPIALTWLILAGVSMGLAAIIGLPGFATTSLLLTAAMITALLSPAAYVALTLSISLATCLIAAAICGIAETFFSAVWALTYREMHGLGLTGEEAALASARIARTRRV